MQQLMKQAQKMQQQLEAAQAELAQLEVSGTAGGGPKSAQRIAFHLLAAEQADVERLASTLVRVKNEVRFCTICGNVAESEQCRICTDDRRDPSLICVVEEPKDVVAIERTREF